MIILRCIRFLWAWVALGWRWLKDGVRWVLTGRRVLPARTLPAGDAPLDGPPTYDPDEVQRETTGAPVLALLENPAHNPKATAQIIAHLSISRAGVMESGKLIFGPDWVPMVVTKYTFTDKAGAPKWKFGCYPAKVIESVVAGAPELDAAGNPTGKVPTAGKRKQYVAQTHGYMFPPWWRKRHADAVRAMMHYLQERLNASAKALSYGGMINQ